MNEWTNGRTNSYMDGRTDGRTNGQLDKLKNVLIISSFFEKLKSNNQIYI